MARKSVGPWFYEAKQTWYVWHNGKRFSLKVKGESNEEEAIKAWHRFLADPPSPPKKLEKGATLTELVEGFLVAKMDTVKEYTHSTYEYLLGKATAKFGNRTAVSLRSPEVLLWINSLSVSQSTRSDLARVLLGVCRWAEQTEVLPSNPLRSLKRPHGESRGSKSVITPETHSKLLEVVSPELKILLTLLRETGARPSELSGLKAAEVDFQNQVAVLTSHKTTNHTGTPRVLILTPVALEILRKQANLYPSGSLLRNTKGKPWTKNVIGVALRRASKRAKVKVIAYGYRHTFATEGLVKGIPDATVAALLGHKSTEMLHKHYSHLTNQVGLLKEAAAKIRGSLPLAEEKEGEGKKKGKGKASLAS